MHVHMQCHCKPIMRGEEEGERKMFVELIVGYYCTLVTQSNSHAFTYYIHAAVLHLTSKGALNTEAPSGGEEIEH